VAAEGGGVKELEIGVTRALHPQIDSHSSNPEANCSAVS